MPDTKTKATKKKGKEAGGLGGAKAGSGIVQSVLDLQKSVGNEQTIKTVLGPDVPSQFQAMADRGKGGPLFFATSTFKQLSKSLGEYAAKQGAKGGAWRRGQVDALDELLTGWFAKDKGGGGEAEKTKRAAMQWLQPKVKQEKTALSGTKAQERQAETPSPAPSPSEPQSKAPSWQGATAPGGDRGAVVIGGGRGAKKQDEPKQDEPKQDEPKQQEPDPEPPRNDDPHNIPLDDVEEEVSSIASPTRQSDEQVVVPGATGGGSSDASNYTGNFIPDADDLDDAEQVRSPKHSYAKNVALHDMEDVSSIGSPTVQSDDAVELPVSPGRKAYSNYGANTIFLDPYRDDVSSAGSPTIESGQDAKAVAKEVIAEDENANVVGNDAVEVEPEPKVVEDLPKPKYDAYKELDTYYKAEFKTGGKHLVDIYKDGKKATGDRESIAERLQKGWGWKASTFNKYWDKMVGIFGGNDDLEEKYKDISVSSVASKDAYGDTLSSDKRAEMLADKKIDEGQRIDFANKLMARGIDWEAVSVSSVATHTSGGGTISTGAQNRATIWKRLYTANELKTDPEAITVKKKTTDEDRAKYRLKLGTTIVRGPQSETLDTKQMVSNTSGAGFGIFVMSPTGDVYVGSHKVGIFHHSSFLAGGNVAAAGEMKVSGGKLQTLTNKSGHYKPTHEHNLQVISELQESGIAFGSYAFTAFDENGKKTEFGTAEAYLNTVPELRRLFPALKKP
jgi:hypothetical protein